MPAIYHKPIRLLMKEDMVRAFALEPGQTFTRQDAIEWFARNYERIKPGAIQCHLLRLSTNAPVRLHYSAKPREDDVFFKIDSKHFRLFDPARDPAPIHGAGTGVEKRVTEDEDVVDAPGSSEFAYEADLRNYLAKNLSIIEPGLALYEDEDINGIEFPVGGRSIDILAMDARSDFVVIELKVSRGYDRVIGQLMRYMAWIRKNLADANQNVRGIIVARKISEDLVLACSLLDNVQLFEYELSLTVKPVETKTGT